MQIDPVQIVLAVKAVRGDGGSFMLAEGVTGMAVAVAATPGWAAGFHAGSRGHAIVLVMVAFAAFALIVAGRRCAGTPNQDRLRGALRIVWAIVWVIWEGRNLLPAHLSWRNSLPLHICSVVGIAIHIVLWTNWRPARAIVALIGIFVCSQALFTPPALHGPASSGFWVYFVSHGMIVVIALYDVIVNGFRPTWRDWRTAATGTIVYAMVIFPLNVALGANYGFLGRWNAGPWKLVDALGPWPWRAPLIIALMLSVTALPVAAVKLRRRLKANGTFASGIGAASFGLPLMTLDWRQLQRRMVRFQE